jgi:integrase
MHHILAMIGKRFVIVLRPHGIRHTVITEVVKVTARGGISLDHAMDFSRHAKIDTILQYHDRERNVCGKIARSVSETISPLKLPENSILPMEDQVPTDR